jgi:hypothetical protein
LEQALERLEELPKRIDAGITRIGCQNFNRKTRFFWDFCDHILDYGKYNDIIG